MSRSPSDEGDKYRIDGPSDVSDGESTWSQTMSDASKNEQKHTDDLTGSLLGEVLEGRYKIERQLGEGGMGVVYLASHTVIEKMVAIKVLRAEVAQSRSVVERFIREARSASRVGHSNIIDVTDFGTTAGGMTYQVMEYLPGATLASVLMSERVLSIERSMRIAKQIARGLQAVHKKGIVHRDLKPENVFLIDRNGSCDFVKIVDFGIAKVVTDTGDPDAPRLTSDGTVIGTPRYMSPEQAAGRHDVDHRADIYSLGIILYEMLSGSVPLQGETVVSTLAMQIMDQPKSLLEVESSAEISEELNAAVMKALIKDPAVRYQQMGDFLAALEKATTGSKVSVGSFSSSSQHALDMKPKRDAIPDILLEVQPKIIGGAGSVLRHEFSGVTVGANGETAVRDHGHLNASSRSSFSYVTPPPSGLGEGWLPLWAYRPALLVAVPFMLAFGIVAALVVRGVFVSSESSRDDSNIDARQSTAWVADAGGENFQGMDAGTIVAVADKTSDAGRGTDYHPVGQEHVELTVITSPRGARLLGEGVADVEMPVRDVLTLRRPMGTVLTFGCRLSGHIDGTVTLHFDGVSKLHVCRLNKAPRVKRTRRFKNVRSPKCVEGVLNPFDDCPSVFGDVRSELDGNLNNDAEIKE